MSALDLRLSSILTSEEQVFRFFYVSLISEAEKERDTERFHSVVQSPPQMPVIGRAELWLQPQSRNTIQISHTAGVNCDPNPTHPKSAFAEN